MFRLRGVQVREAEGPQGVMATANDRDAFERAYKPSDRPVPILVEYRRLPAREGTVATPPATSPTRVVVRWTAVDSRNDEWALTAIRLRRGDIAIIHAEGQIDLNGAGMARTPGQNYEAYAPNGRLDIKIGDSFYTTYRDNYYIRATEEVYGEVKVRIHDSNYLDNEGSYAVRVLYVPAEAIPPQADTCPPDVCSR